MPGLARAIQDLGNRDNWPPDLHVYACVYAYLYNCICMCMRICICSDDNSGLCQEAGVFEWLEAANICETKSVLRKKLWATNALLKPALVKSSTLTLNPKPCHGHCWFVLLPPQSSQQGEAHLRSQARTTLARSCNFEI